MAKKKMKIQYGDYAPKETLIEKPKQAVKVPESKPQPRPGLLKKEPPKPVLQPKPEPEPRKKEPPEDLFIVADSGYLGEDSTGSSVLYRIRVANSKGIVDNIDKKKIQWGYGFDRQESIRDFIRRNNSDVIERVFNAH